MQQIITDVGTNETEILDFTEAEILEMRSAFASPVRFPNWEVLYGRLLLGDLKPILLDLKQVAKTDNAIAIDFMSLTAVLSSIRTEQALQDCLIELINDGYVLSDEHRRLWNNAIAELNFSDLVKL